MDSDLADATSAEETSKKEFDVLIAAKTKELDALTKEVEDKTARVGDDGVKLSEMKEDLEDTEESLEEDKKFLAELDKSCATKQAEWDERCKMRTEELLALSDTIKILNDDDALELFKKTLPGSAALLQMKVTTAQTRKAAIAALSSHKGYHLDLISMALRGKKVSMDKVVKMIDDMVALLGKEQADDDSKKEMCEMQIDKAEDDMKTLDVTISDLAKSIEDSKGEIATLTDEIAALTDGLKQLDKDVAEQMDMRKEEHEDYVSGMAANTAAVELIEFAKNRLQKFYNPGQYKAPPKRKLSEEERITPATCGSSRRKTRRP